MTYPTIIAAISDNVMIAAITSGISGVVAVASLLINILVKNKVGKMSKDVNGHMTKLLKLTEEKGIEEGKELAEHKNEA